MFVRCCLKDVADEMRFVLACPEPNSCIHRNANPEGYIGKKLQTQTLGHLSFTTMTQG